MHRKISLILIVVLVVLMVPATAACNGSAATVSTGNDDITRPEGWTELTHGNQTYPNYDIVFPQDKVNQIKITISPDNWEAMQANLVSLFGTQRDGQQGAFPGGPPAGGFAPGELPPLPPDGLPPDGQAPLDGFPPQNFDARPQAPGIPGGINPTGENPMWVPATIEFNGLAWTNVGVRYKGNSSLRSSWNSGTLKLPLKMDFDEFEDEYPEIQNQRFYGFKQLSFSNAFNDRTYMHDTLGSDILKDAGLVAAETAYYEVVLDYGEGATSLGLYVMIEVVDDTVIESFFGDDSGNIYEGDGRGVSLAAGTYNLIEDSFQKENNKGDSDWSDIQTLYNVLHSTERTSDPDAWRSGLESIFDVDTFLEWLAISAVIQHWDAYGSMTHNFYLYHNPVSDQLVWISWDHNEILGVGGGMPGGRVGRQAPGGGMRRNVTLAKDEVDENWPLIRYLLDDEVYYERYVDYIEETVNGAFDPDKLEKKCRELAEMIEPYAVNEFGLTTFESAVQQLIDSINERYQAAIDFLATGGK